MYRTLHVFISIFTDVFSGTVVSAMIVVGFLGTSLAAYGVVNLYGKLSLAYYSFLLIYMFIGYMNIILSFMLMSPVYECSKNFHKSSVSVTKLKGFLRLHSRKVMRKSVNASRPLQHSVANFYRVKKECRIESIGFLNNLIFYLLLT